MPFSDEQQQRVSAWLQAKHTAQQWADYERQLRDALISEHFAGQADGTFKLEIANGHILKVVRSTRWKVEDGPTLHQAAEAINAMFPGQGLPGRLIGFKPELRYKEYKDTHPTVQRMLHPVLTSTPNAPQLSVDSPKDNKR